ncbi:hypothetical protein PVAND_009898 [Polypedilum vanderplanki]|uniref:Uncharacterized protein n=1 Tax=Polypedilum vanderplanki TaxID=319348 RepID=A0A9J6CEN7_POLVA|nr:hypothetical protein PVAND_009898 [Polypedilum vanderplanki]
MRLTRSLLRYVRGNKPARAPQNENKVPFQAILPLKLRERVSGKVDSVDTVPCLQELSILFAAMKDHDFDEKLCKKEIEALKKAHEIAEVQKKEDKARNSGLVVSTGRKLTSLQLNRYLKRFPLKVQEK